MCDLHLGMCPVVQTIFYLLSKFFLDLYLYPLLCIEIAEPSFHRILVLLVLFFLHRIARLFFLLVELIRIYCFYSSNLHSVGGLFAFSLSSEYLMLTYFYFPFLYFRQIGLLLFRMKRKQLSTAPREGLPYSGHKWRQINPDVSIDYKTTTTKAAKNSRKSNFFNSKNDLVQFLL